MLLLLGNFHLKWVLILPHYAVLPSELMSRYQSFSIFLDFPHNSALTIELYFSSSVFVYVE